MPGSMNNFDAASDGQYFSRCQGVVDGNRLQSFVGIEEKFAHHLPQQTRCRPHRPKRASTLGHGDIERVHVGPRTGLPHDRSGAADMIRVAVSENQVFELVWRTAKPADRPEDGCLLTPEPGIDQRQAIVAFDQEGVCHPVWPKYWNGGSACTSQGVPAGCRIPAWSRSGRFASSMAHPVER